MCMLAPVCDAGRVPLQCVIVDDSDPFLDASRVLLERQGLDIVGVANTAAEGVQRARELRPDVVLVDIDLEGESGFTVVSELATEPDTCPTILISTHAGEDFADLVADSTALGFIAKSDLSAQSVRELLEEF
jgi:two-component system nitrate/nitrite response regulator NarL